MYRSISVLLLAVCALLMAPQAAATAGVNIIPASGSQNTTFTVAGDGLQPGLALDVNFVSPEGTIFSTAFLNKVVVVGADGTFGLSVIPAQDFTGASFGTWRVQVCVSGTDDCIDTTFEILP